MKDEESPLDDAILRSLKAVETPPESLEQKVVQALKAEGLIGVRRTKGARFLWKFAAAAVLLLSLFAAGFWAGQTSRTTAASTTSQPVFALFLYEPAGRFTSAPDQVREYGEWIGTVRSRGRLAGGEKLKESGRTLKIDNGKLQIVERPLRSQEVLMGGYFLIQASSYQEAMRIAAQCPHLKYGGVIEIRQIEPT